MYVCMRARACVRTYICIYIMSLPGGNPERAPRAAERPAGQADHSDHPGGRLPGVGERGRPGAERGVPAGGRRLPYGG